MPLTKNFTTSCRSRECMNLIVHSACLIISKFSSQNEDASQQEWPACCRRLLSQLCHGLPVFKLKVEASGAHQLCSSPQPERCWNERRLPQRHPALCACPTAKVLHLSQYLPRWGLLAVESKKRAARKLCSAAPRRVAWANVLVTRGPGFSLSRGCLHGEELPPWSDACKCLCLVVVGVPH